MGGRLFIDPAEVTPENAQLVLDFLNTAGSAQEIADTVEIPGELDIGLRLAERIIARRAQLGSFTTLQQVAAVPLIGPKRFTDIVITLSNQRVPGRTPTPIELLQQELAALRQRIDAGAVGSAAVRRHLTLRPIEPHTFLGEPTLVIATLTEGDRPVVDAPIAFVATRGELSTSDGYAAHRGHLITARTGLDGTVRLTMMATTREEITALQHDALISMLSLLDAKAPAPRDTETGLHELARQYAWEVNLPFRQAVDIYVRDFQPQLLDTINARDQLDSWSFSDAAILAFAPADGTSADASSVAASSVAATATLHLRIKDWIPPFLETFVALSRRESTLTDELRDLSQSESDTGRLVTAIYDRAGRYVASRYGEVGAYVGRKVAESSIRGFLDRDLESLPLDARVDVFPALDIASKTLANTNAGVIQSIVGTRKDIAKDMDRKVGKGTLDLNGILDRVGGLEALVDRTRTDFAKQLAARVTATQFNAALADRVTQAELNSAVSDKVTQTQMSSALADKVTQTQMTSALGKKLDTTAFNTFSTNVSKQFTTVNTNISQLRPR